MHYPPHNVITQTLELLRTCSCTYDLIFSVVIMHICSVYTDKMWLDAESRVLHDLEWQGLTGYGALEACYCACLLLVNALDTFTKKLCFVIYVFEGFHSCSGHIGVQP